MAAREISREQHESRLALREQETARALGCRRAREALHRRKNVSLATRCTGVRNVCAVGERLVLMGSRRQDEASALSRQFEHKVRDFVWAERFAHLTLRGTISALDMQPARYCALNSTVDGIGRRATCTGDSDANDDKQHWIPLDPRAASVNPLEMRSDFALTFFPIYSQSWGETFGNTLLPLFELYMAGWINDQTLLLPSYFTFRDLLKPLTSAEAIVTLQELEARQQRRCFRQLVVCHLSSFVFDREFGRGADSHNVPGPERHPWDAMQFIVARSGDSAFRRHAKATAAAWRQPKLLCIWCDTVLRLLLVERSGRRKISNVHQLRRECRASELQAVGKGRWSKIHNIVCSVHRFGHSGFVEDVKAARDADLMVGTHGADLVNSLAMHRGASVLEVRPAGFIGQHGLGTSWHQDFLGLDHAIFHYHIQLGPNETLTPQANIKSQPGFDSTWLWETSFDVRLPTDALRTFIERVEETSADVERYTQLRERRQTHIRLS